MSLPIECPRCPTCGQPDIAFDLLTEDEPDPRYDFGFECADCGLTITQCMCGVERDAKEELCR